jgi:hypothetical protein
MTIEKLKSKREYKCTSVKTEETSIAEENAEQFCKMDSKTEQC